jgi:signal transduction histidine kinase
MNLNLQGLKRDVESGRIPRESARPVELCLKEVQRLDRVVGGVLSLARPPSGAREPCSIHAVIYHILDVIREQLARGKVRPETNFGAEMDTVLGETEALEALFLNLSLNAVEAMPHGGRLRISTEPLKGPGGKPGIRIRVADEGIGIPRQTREEIFKPFFSTKKDGTGLGLSLAARIAENHGGDLRLVDSSGAAGGSEFAVELPLATDECTE